MKLKNILLVLLILILIFTLSSRAANPELRNIPFDSKAYDYLKYLEYRGEISPIFNGSKPLSYGDLKEAVLELKASDTDQKIYNYLQQQLNLGSAFADDIYYSAELSGRYANNNQGSNYAFDFKPALWSQPSPHFFAESRLELTVGNQGNYVGPSPAYFKVKYQPFLLEIGKTRLHWGPGEFASLSVATDSYPTPYFYSNSWFKDLEEIDLFKLTAVFSSLRFSYFTAADYYFLGRREGDEPAISGLRADWRVNDNLRIGAGDTILSPDSLETAVLVTDPVSYFTGLVDSPQQEENMNLMGTVDFNLTLKPLGEFYGEFIWDSTVDEESKDDYGTDQAGAKTGWLAGYYRPFKTEKALYSIKAEYAEIDDTTYTFPYNQNLIYKYGESWLGHWAGSDSKSVVLQLNADYDQGWKTQLTYTGVKKDVELKPEKELDIYTLRVIKNINKKHKITAYLQRADGEQFLKGAADTAALEYQYSF